MDLSERVENLGLAYKLMDNPLESSRNIMSRAVEEFSPYAAVLMLSGGDDSLTAYHVAKEINAHIDFVCHIRTGTGLPATTEFVKHSVKEQADRLIIADAGMAYEDYVLRKGFFGLGRTAHNYAYHLLKAGPYRKVISREIRKRKRNRPVLLLNGARKDESENRTVKLGAPFNRDPAARNNIWINILYDWTKRDCMDYLKANGIERNPVSVAMHRSGECMCGTMQSNHDRKMAGLLYPEWAAWLDELEKRVHERGFRWSWGQATTREIVGDSAQMELPVMCLGCEFQYESRQNFSEEAQDD